MAEAPAGVHEGTKGCGLPSMGEQRSWRWSAPVYTKPFLGGYRRDVLFTGDPGHEKHVSKHLLRPCRRSDFPQAVIHDWLGEPGLAP
jgi:hypothetical protein